MRTIIISILALLMGVTSFGQTLMTRSGTIHFFSNTPLENIEAINNQVSSVINLETGELAFTLLMKAFVFEKALMQEHFNEKYVESDQFPKSTFEGKIENYQFDVTSQDVNISGTLTIHGQEKLINATATLESIDNGIHGHSTFSIDLDDFNIKIPSAVKDNIAKTILITVDLIYEKL